MIIIDSLAKLLLANDLESDAFLPSGPGEDILRGEVPAGRVFQTWVNLAKAAAETK